MLRDNLNVVDFFAGAGGLSLGAVRAGFNVAGAIELDKKAIDTHIRNFPNTKHFEIDLSKIKASELKKILLTDIHNIDGIIGGPPCQGFSYMGHRNENDVRNNLFMRFFEFIEEIRPSFFVAENVLGILDDKYKSLRDAALNKITGYTILSPLIIRADEYGAPTTRTRVFFIGYRKKEGINLSENDFYSAKVPENEKIRVKDALLGLPTKIYSEGSGYGKLAQKELEKLKRPETLSFYKHIRGLIPQGIGNPKSIALYRKKIVTGCFPTKHSEEIINRYENLKYGQQDNISKSVKLNPDGFCPTLRAGTGPEKGSYQAVRPIHFAEPRVITPREAARLQGFPDWFEFQPTIWHSFRQIGNSVSPIVAEKILSVIFQKFT